MYFLGDFGAHVNSKSCKMNKCKTRGTCILMDHFPIPGQFLNNTMVTVRKQVTAHHYLQVSLSCNSLEGATSMADLEWQLRSVGSAPWASSSEHTWRGIALWRKTGHTAPFTHKLFHCLSTETLQHPQTILLFFQSVISLHHQHKAFFYVRGRSWPRTTKTMKIKTH